MASRRFVVGCRREENAMLKMDREAEVVMAERFGKDTVLALATVEDGAPHVRNVDAYYENGAFYIVTDSRSGKMAQIRKDPRVAVAGEWFTGHGYAEDLGPFGCKANEGIANRLRQAFAAWLDNGHTDPAAEQTHVLRVTLRDGLLLSHGKRYALGEQ